MSGPQRSKKEIAASYEQLKSLLPATKRQLVTRMGLTLNIVSRMIIMLKERNEVYVSGCEVQKDACRRVAVYAIKTKPEQKDVNFDPCIIPKEPDEDDGIHVLDIERERKRLQAKAQKNVEQVLKAGGDPLVSLFFGRKTINEVQQGS